MSQITDIYRENLTLLTDFYQLTMAYAGWKNGFEASGQQRVGVFNLYFRKNPFAGGFAVSCGLSTVLDYIESFRFEEKDLKYLSELKGSDQAPLFSDDFLKYLSELKIKVDIDAVEEGRVVFANEPLLRVQGPLIQCQLLETALLNMINFETLVATKAARVKESAGVDQVLEFGLRRAQGIDGGLIASKAAFVGGADATSNVLAGKIYGIPVRGTHAHSWVMAYEDEKEAFFKFAQAMPNNTVLLVDTYNTLEGVHKAVEVGQWLKQQGHQLLGIRLDSGDLAYLSIEARKILNQAGLSDVKIVASNDLDETLIQNLKQQGAQIDIWGVGTKLVTAFDQPALGGVYKLVALKEGASDWKMRIKLSEQISKVTTPGIHQIRRYKKEGFFVGDMIYDERLPLQTATIIDPMDSTRSKTFTSDMQSEDLLKPVLRKGQRVVPQESLVKIKQRCQSDLNQLHPTIKRFLNPHIYPLGLESQLWKLKHDMILEKRGKTQ